jgi:hypothetical protein
VGFNARPASKNGSRKVGILLRANRFNIFVSARSSGSTATAQGWGQFWRSAGEATGVKNRRRLVHGHSTLASNEMVAQDFPEKFAPAIAQLQKVFVKTVERSVRVK